MKFFFFLLLKKKTKKKHALRSSHQPEDLKSTPHRNSAVRSWGGSGITMHFGLPGHSSHCTPLHSIWSRLYSLDGGSGSCPFFPHKHPCIPSQSHQCHGIWSSYHHLAHSLQTRGQAFQRIH